jgi:hypothetical protein
MKRFRCAERKIKRDRIRSETCRDEVIQNLLEEKLLQCIGHVKRI